MDADKLARLDAGGVREVGALTYIRESSDDAASLAGPCLFATDLGTSCWLKKQSQYGLFSELIGGRLGVLTGAGPRAHAVRVPKAALPEDGSADRFLGLCVGTEDLPGTENSKFFVEKEIVLSNDMIDADQRALVVAFQTWLRVQDHQVMVDFASGRIFSHDHGECFGHTSNPGDLQLVVCPLNGVDTTHGNDPISVARAVALVEGCDDEKLLEAVAGVPGEWGADGGRRLGIAQWLAHRRDRIGEVMAQWR
jgi:hypothetical protein